MLRLVGTVSTSGWFSRSSTGLAGWLVGWLADWLVGWLVGWLGDSEVLLITRTSCEFTMLIIINIIIIIIIIITITVIIIL
jgi:hypothetical protein